MRKEKRNDLHPFSNDDHQRISHIKIYQTGGIEMQILTLIINALTVLLLLFIFLINKNNR